MDKRAVNLFARVSRLALIFVALPIVIPGLLIWTVTLFGRAGIEAVRKSGAAKAHFEA